LNTYVDTSQGVGVKFKLNKGSYEGFTSVTLTDVGILDFTVDSDFVAHEDSVISYVIYEEAGTLSDTGYVYICKVDNCKGVIVPEGQECNSCDGVLTPILPNISID
jgi:hypothetical protein